MPKRPPEGSPGIAPVADAGRSLSPQSADRMLIPLSSHRKVISTVFEDPQEDPQDDRQHFSYLKGARQDPLPWEDQGGPPTGPMASLTQEMLASMEDEAARHSTLGRPALPAPPPTRMERRRKRKADRRRFSMRLVVMALVAFMLAFLFAAYIL